MSDSNTLSGIIIEVGDIAKGEANGSAWKRLTFVVEVPGQYQYKVEFQINSISLIEAFDNRVGDDVTVSFNVRSKKVGTRYFSDIIAWKIQRNGYQHTGNTQQRSSAPNPPESNFSQGDGLDDLKF